MRVLPSTTMGAFRTAADGEVIEAPTQDGLLRLEVAPRHVTLAIRGVQIAITGEFVTVTQKLRNRIKRSSERLTGALVVARDVPHEDVGLWMEIAPGSMRRIFGVAPHDLIADDGLAALRALDRLAGRLRQVLQPYSNGARRAYEVGRGLDKVLLIDHVDRLSIHARRLFADHARRVATVHADGVIELPRRNGKFAVLDRYGVTVTGDLIRFLDPAGTDLGKVPLHWIAPEDRQEVARRIGEVVERGQRVDLAADEPAAEVAPVRRKYKPRALWPRLLPHRR